MAEPGGNKPAEPCKSDRKRREKTTGKHVASHQWIPKASRQQAAPGDQRGGPAATHIGLQSNVENPQKTGPGKRHLQILQEEPEFGDTWDVMRAKEPCHHRSHENKSCQTKSPTAISPAQAQVPPSKHCTDHQHRKQQNNENHIELPVRRQSADTAACVRGGSRGQSTRSRRACPGMPRPRSASGYRGARPAILSTQRARRYKQEASRSAVLAATWTDRVPRQRTAVAQSGEGATPAGLSTCGGTAMN